MTPARGTTLGVFRFRRFLLFSIGQAISGFGDWMQIVVGGWLIAGLSESKTLIAALYSISIVPLLAFMLLGGTLADRGDRRKIVLVTELLLCALAWCAAAVVATGRFGVGVVVLWLVVSGTLVGFNLPAKRALPAELVPHEHLPATVTIGTITFFAARAVGPALAAWLLTMGPPSWVFVANGLSYLPLLIALVVMRTRAPTVVRTRAADVLKQGALDELLQYVRGNRQARGLLVLAALIAGCVLPFYSILMPAFVKTAMHGTEADLGFVLSSAGIGAVLGSLFLIVIWSRARGAMLAVAVLVVASGLCGIAGATDHATVAALMGAVAFGIALFDGLIGTQLQLMVPDRLRGRVLGLLELILTGGSAVAAVGVGVLSDHLGLRAMMTGFAIVFASAGLRVLVSARLLRFEPAVPEDAPEGDRRVGPGGAQLCHGRPHDQSPG